MKKLIFIGLAALAVTPAYAQEEEGAGDPNQNKLEIRQSQKELAEEYEKKLALERDPDSKYLPMNQFINSGRRR